MGSRSLLLVVLVALCGVAHGDDRAKAREVYRSATSHYDLREFREALADFKEAYRQLPEPTFLYNIAQCHRQLGEREDAIRFFRTYLAKLPNAPNRNDVMELMARLEREQHDAAPAPVTPVPVTPITPVAPAPVATARTPAPVVAPITQDEVVSTAPPQRTPVYKKWWLWTTVGVVVAAGLGIGLGIGLSQPHTPSASTEGGTFKPSFQ